MQLVIFLCNQKSFRDTKGLIRIRISKDRQKGFYVHNYLPYFSHTDSTRKQTVHILYVIRGLINVKSAVFQLCSGQDQAEQ